MQAYYAVKANPAPEIVRTLYRAGASFDVASLPEFLLVYENIKQLAGQGAAGFHLGQDHLRQPHQAQGDAAGAGPIQAADDLRQPGRAAQDQALRAARGPGAAAAGAEHGLDGGAVVEVRLRSGRGGGPDPGGVPRRAGGGGPELPRGQPVHELRQFRAGAQHRRGGDAGSALARARDQDPGYRRRFPGALRPRR